MEYFITFLEGLITFISPCLLPMLPIYLTYLAGSDEEHTQSATLKNAAGFITGFSLMFIIMGAFAGSIGMLLSRHQTLINIICGLIIIVFGLKMCIRDSPIACSKTFPGQIPYILPLN